jgi:MFS family permease
LLSQVLALGFTQTIAWAASTYLIAIIAAPVARDLGLATPTVFGAFSVALVVMGIAGPAAGRAIDRFGGRGILAASDLVLALGLIVLGLAPNAAALFAAWCVLGLGMALGLYEAAFATLVRIHGSAARSPITGITLIAGFASTVGWPVTALVTGRYGWRASCFAWAAILVFVCLPINLAFVPKASGRPKDAESSSSANAEVAASRRGSSDYRRAFFLLVIFGATTSFVTSAMAAHLPGLLLAVGTTGVAALAASAMLGPAQVAARLIEFLAARRFRFHPLVTARIATAFHPMAGTVLAFFGGPAAVASLFAILHGAGNGMITIAKGTLPLSIFGAAGYGERQGLLSVLGRAMQAIAPFAFGVVVERYGPRWGLGVSVALSLVALAALVALRPSQNPADAGRLGPRLA